ncbi:MAG: ATP-independent RNA helicase DbpA [Myxococcota bacterium]|jgi:ATP-independent RNA helicase DbpA
MNSFSALPLDPALLRAIEVLGFASMTPVQAESLPVLLKGSDVIGQARTGSGKTVAFGLALLAAIDVHHVAVQSLILCPTRELADQVTDAIRRLARFIPNLKVVTLCGGVPCRAQAPSLKRAPHVVVGTPGRVLDHLGRGNLELSQLRVWVLDEADRMLDMGFSEPIRKVASMLPAKRQTLLFSATFPDDIRRLSRTLQQSPTEITVDIDPVPNQIDQTFFEVKPDQKFGALAALLRVYDPESALVFCHTRNDTREVAAELKNRGFSVLALHGELDQRDRDEAMLRFANRSCAVLVATDVAARGLDVEALAAVISYELPHDPDTHLHRIGRTGRAGREGLALSLCARRERPRAEAIEAELGSPLEWMPLPVLESRPVPTQPPMVTLLINGGRQDKLRPGDIVGALTGPVGLAGEAVGKINVQARRAYVAVRREDVDQALIGLRKHPIKKRSFRVRRLA